MAGGPFSWLDILCHLASLLEAVAFLQNDMSRLRAFAALAFSLMAIYSFLKSDFDYFNCHFVWSIFHTLIHLVHLGVEAKEHYSLRLNDDERSLLEDGGLFRVFQRSEFAALKRYSKWVKHPLHSELVNFGTECGKLYLIIRGCIVLSNKDGETFASVDTDETGPQFLGELSFFTRQSASATVKVASVELVAMEWDMQKVRDLSSLAGDSSVARAFRQLPSIFSTQIATRLANEETARSNPKMRSQSIMRTTSCCDLSIDDIPFHHGPRSRSWSFSSFSSVLSDSSATTSSINSVIANGISRIMGGGGHTATAVVAPMKSPRWPSDSQDQQWTAGLQTVPSRREMISPGVPDIHEYGDTGTTAAACSTGEVEQMIQTPPAVSTKSRKTLKDHGIQQSEEQEDLVTYQSPIKTRARGLPGDAHNVSSPSKHADMSSQSPQKMRAESPVASVEQYGSQTRRTTMYNSRKARTQKFRRGSVAFII